MHMHLSEIGGLLSKVYERQVVREQMKGTKIKTLSVEKEPRR